MPSARWDAGKASPAWPSHSAHGHDRPPSPPAPGSRGALLRAAECSGVTGVVLPRHRSVHITPTVTKAAAGAIEHLPMVVVAGLPAALERLKGLGLWIVGLDGGGEQRIDDLPL